MCNKRKFIILTILYIYIYELTYIILFYSRYLCPNKMNKEIVRTPPSAELEGIDH
jgi:hypothetical protein